MYSFTEMFNNAIEHSESEKISCYVECNYIETTILIMDYGVGIFKKIQDYFGYNSIDDAINELFVKFANNNPSMKLSVVNSNQRIDAMINHVKNTR